MSEFEVALLSRLILCGVAVVCASAVFALSEPRSVTRAVALGIIGAGVLGLTQ